MNHTEREEHFRNLRTQRDLRAAKELADTQRVEFLRKLQNQVLMLRVNVTPWEEEFIADMVASPRPMSDAQIKVVNELRQKYAHRISPTVKLTDRSGEGKVATGSNDSRDAATDTGRVPASPENSFPKS